MKLFELNLEQSKLMMIQFSPKTADPKIHGHGSDFQLSIPLIGTPFIQINNQDRKFQERWWCITSPDEKHYHYSNEAGSRLLLINLKKSFLERVLAERLERTVERLEFSPWVEGSAEGFKKMVTRMMKHTLDSSLHLEELQEFEYELASLLFSHTRGTHSNDWIMEASYTDHPSLRKAMDYIHDDFSNELDLDTLSNASGISKYYLIRLFREYVGQTPSQYIADYRLRHAEQLLRKTSCEVTDIAFEVGFGSLNTFERLFKKKYGMTASEFRKRV
ncbi:AraC family transcriptional regulator [Brevibacillus nitrificans]|uniref:AraC family transcriptional regulator n=1 Tax=Brevibacillus nitrificans TaxID=651560 RepID=UPI0028669397|nr:AraC family transcriptional regulator [Brevibacillus nitrificans]MDR7318077.1 AraC-like DNA-binding protein [Brevibacillus nitrificans]